uniref:Retrovirus-related Pol polyprotein from transposon opus n=1 Tax=Cajanus cajan TaxID=3821 RepID=A0A151SDJ8_CAJCA|nr:Retrovirus-related Pol polyprotein from transposon opus [Cajanus cajan]
MTFSLKNAGATYQRLMDKVFHQQIGRNMEVYVDDMVVKTTSTKGHAADLAEVFSQIRKHNMRLNPEKCVFSIQGGKFLGFTITSRGIEANPEKCKAIIKMQSPQTVKEVQRLAGRKSELAGRMIAWSVELSEFGIKYESRGPLEAQCLVDFVAELTPTSADEQQVWTLHVDGSSNSKGGGAGIILEGPNHVTLEQSLKFSFKVTNNQAEYEALLARLRLAHDLGARRRYFHMASQKISSFDEFTIHHVPREQNARADLLSKLASTKRPGQHRTIIQKTLHSPSLDDKVVNTSDSRDLGWMTGI